MHSPTVGFWEGAEVGAHDASHLARTAVLSCVRSVQ